MDGSAEAAFWYLRIAVEDYGSRLATWARWQQVAAAAQGTQG